MTNKIDSQSLRTIGNELCAMANKIDSNHLEWISGTLSFSSKTVEEETFEKGAVNSSPDITIIKITSDLILKEYHD